MYREKKRFTLKELLNFIDDLTKFVAKSEMAKHLLCRESHFRFKAQHRLSQM